MMYLKIKEQRHNHGEMFAPCKVCEKLFSSIDSIFVLDLTGENGADSYVIGKGPYEIVGFICPRCLTLSPEELDALHAEKIAGLEDELLERKVMRGAKLVVEPSGDEPISSRTVH